MIALTQTIEADLERSRALAVTGLLSAPAPAEFEAACRQACARFGVPMAMVTLLDQDRVVAKAGVGIGLGEAPRAHQFCDEAVRRDEVMVVPDARDDARFARNPLVAGRPFLRFYAGAPLSYVRGIRLGALCLMDRRPRELSVADRAELERLADGLMAVVIEREFDRIVQAVH